MLLTRTIEFVSGYFQLTGKDNLLAPLPRTFAMASEDLGGSFCVCLLAIIAYAAAS